MPHTPPITPAPSSPPQAGTSAADLIATYLPIKGTPDAMVDDTGVIRPAWDALAAQLRSVGASTLDRRRDQALRIIDENGIPHPDEADLRDSGRRAWSLDPVPFQLNAEAFDTLAGALSQRARLLNHLVVDLLGEQRCLREKILPPSLLFANPRYHRAYHDLPVSGGRYVHLFASDVFLGTDGRWWATGDATQAPAGLGYLLENRVALARVHTDWFDALNVRRLTGTLDVLRDTLANLAPRNRRNPHVVVLGHDPEEPRGFEDEFLARYLRYTFAVGEDIVVRQGQTVLRTLGGAVPIDVLLRRIPDDRCDPVELAPDAPDGIAGLVDSQRRGEVSIANMLGSQLAEAPGLLAFLDPLCRFYFGEQLALPSVPTWWCGQRSALSHVLANIDSLIVRPAFDAEADPIDARLLSQAERKALAEEIETTPDRFAAQKPPALTTTPGWEDGALHPAEWTMRAFAMLRGDTHEAVPGGVVRLPSERRSEADRAIERGRVQDCWVLADSPVTTPRVSTLDGETVRITRAGADLPSRVAEKLYWIGRRIEAFEHRARLLRALLIRATDDLPLDTEASADHPWLRFFDLIPGVEGVTHESAKMAAASAVTTATGEAGPGNDLDALLSATARTARAVRDRLSADAWRLINQTEKRLQTAGRIAGQSTRLNDPDYVEIAAILDESILDAAAFAGLMGESMTRTLAWRFLDMGRRVERAAGMARLIATGAKRASVAETDTLGVLLEVGDSAMTYRSRYLADVRFPPVLDLLMVDESNPRSVAFQLATIADHLSSLPRENADAPLDDDQRIAVRLLDLVRLAEVDRLAKIASSPEPGVRTELVELCNRVTDELPLAERAFSARFLVHAALPKQFLDVDASPASVGGRGGANAGSG